MNPQDKFCQQLLNHNLRIDGREPLQERKRTALFLDHQGHLVYNQGDTKIVIKAKAEITAPKNERPSEGFIYFRVDCTSLHKSYEEQRKLSTQLSKLLETVIIGSKALDPESLCILSGHYVWKVNVQCLISGDDGNIIDGILNGVVLALMDIRKPLVKFDKDQVSMQIIQLAVDGDIQQTLSLAHLPVSITLALTENNLIADPCISEQNVSKSRITIAMNVYKEICNIHKPGGMSMSQETLSGCVKVAEQRVKTMTEWMRSVIKERPLFSDSL